VTVRFFTHHRAGDGLKLLFLATLHEVRYSTTQGDGRIVFSADGGPTSLNITCPAAM
jgi:hypothetical protein